MYGKKCLKSKLSGGISMKMIEVEHLTKDYGNKKGIFDISFP